MKCEHCGVEVPDGAPYCSECGRPVGHGDKKAKRRKEPREVKKANPVLDVEADVERAEETPKKEKPKKKKRKWKLILALVILALVLGAAGYGYLRLPAFRVQRAMNAGDAKGYQTAAEIYTDEVKDSFFERWITSMLCKERIDAPAEAYFAGDLSYDEAKAFYTAFSDEASKKLSAVSKAHLDDIEADHEAQLMLAAGDKAFEAKDYEAAMEEYAAVPKGIAAYETAQKKLQETREAYITSISDKVDKLVGSGDYDTAMETLNKALKVLPNEEALITKRATVGLAFEAIKLQEAADLIADEEYDDAINLLTEALDLMPDSQKLSDGLDSVRELKKEAEKAETVTTEEPEKEETATNKKP